MLIRNLCQAAGLCNGTVLTVVRLRDYLIEAVISTGQFAGTTHLIPRIGLFSKEGDIPFQFKRFQFPIIVAYSFTSYKG